MINETDSRKCDVFFGKMARQGLALSYGDVRLRTYHSEILPKDACLLSNFSRNVGLNIPIISAPMDTVTEFKMALAMAELGGLGILHKSLTPEQQASAVGRVKHHLNAFIPNPICVYQDDTVESVLNMRQEKEYKFFSFPVKSADGTIVGLVTRNDFDFSRSSGDKIRDIMSKEIVQAEAGIAAEGAYEQMLETRKKILPIFDQGGQFKGIFSFSDVKRIVTGDHNNYNLDANGNLRVGAAIGVGADLEQRMELLAAKKVDVVVIDSAHGDSRGVIEAVKFCKKHYPQIDVVAGNISEAQSAVNLVKAGVDGLRIGQGPGSICTTRIVAGVGCPQVTAVYNCAKAIRGSGVPICADGGIEYSGDISIALAAGAQNVMLGKLLAGATESPGIIIYRNGLQRKIYRGMGSLGAMIESKASRERYGQSDSQSGKYVPEGIEGEVDYKGDVKDIIFQYLGGLRSGLGYLGATNIPELQKRADFYRLTNVGLQESHPHGIDGIKSAPNYSGNK